MFKTTKKILIAAMLAMVLLMNFSVFAEEANGGGEGNNAVADAASSALGGGIGMTFIDGVPFLNLAITPDIGLGPFGVGLDLVLRINTNNWAVRTSDWDNIRDVAKVIRYLRLGTKEAKAFDMIYARVGILETATLGHGILLYNFANSPSQDARSLGMELDLDFNQFGVETVYSNFDEASIIGARGFVRPLKFNPALGALPIIGGFEVGLTYVTDVHEEAKITASNWSINNTVIEVKGDPLHAIAFDLGLPVLRLPMFDTDLFYDLGKYVGLGMGQSFGFISKLNLPGNILSIRVKGERRILQDKFIPAYFNALYLIKRYQPATATSPAGTSARQEIEGKLASSGTYGELMFSVLSAIQIIGGYQKDDRDPDGILHLELKLPPKLIPMIEFSMVYDRVGIKTGKDLFKLDENSLLSGMIGYKPYPFLTVGVKYFWTFEPTPDGGFETQQRVEPTVAASYSF